LLYKKNKTKDVFFFQDIYKKNNNLMKKLQEEIKRSRQLMGLSNELLTEGEIITQIKNYLHKNLRQLMTKFGITETDLYRTKLQLKRIKEDMIDDPKELFTKNSPFDKKALLFKVLSQYGISIGIIGLITQLITSFSGIMSLTGTVIGMVGILIAIIGAAIDALNDWFGK